MRMMHKRITTVIASVLLSVSAFAAPITVESFAVAVPKATVLSQNDNADVTVNDFVDVQPYVVDLAVATHVPITPAAEFAQSTLGLTGNAAVKQNANFERWPS